MQIHWYRNAAGRPDDFVAEAAWLKGAGCPDARSIIFLCAEVTLSDEVLITALVSERAAEWFVSELKLNL